ncbi:MAG TPA: TPM domain-containing protein [Rhizomicrobium sp.]|nr:TPM domain-containing protein [Rhizomicrobium sp.]
MLERFWLSVSYVLAGIISLAWLTLSSATAAPQFPQLTGRVVDEAGILSDQTKQELDGILAGDEQKFGGRQIVVATLKSLQGYEIEDYGYQLGRAWGIGQKGKNNGALIIVAPNEHKVRIEVGYGLEGDLTDAKSRVIIDEYMKPDFKKGDFNAGVLEGTKAVLATLGNTNFAAPDYQQISDDEQAPSGWVEALIIFALVFFFAGRSFFWPLLFMGGGGWGGRGGWGGGGWSSGGGGWSSGGGGGGFSGGGGSFGGGGASGSW